MNINFFNLLIECIGKFVDLDDNIVDGVIILWLLIYIYFYKILVGLVFIVLVFFLFIWFCFFWLVFWL